MLSVASIPFGLFHFTGVIGFIYDGTKEKRIASYRFAKPISIHSGEVKVKQGKTVFIVKQIEKSGHLLAAPQQGKMSRMIKENVRCHCSYTLIEKKKEVFSFESKKASFEYEYPD